VELEGRALPGPALRGSHRPRRADSATGAWQPPPDQYKNLANPRTRTTARTGPEVWRQTSGEITDTSSRASAPAEPITRDRALPQERRADVKVLGVYPAEGTTSRASVASKQLKADPASSSRRSTTASSRIQKRGGFELCRRIKPAKDSIIAGPRLGDGARGGAEARPRRARVVCVVVFPDNAFKYASSMRKHLPQLFAARSRARIRRLAQYNIHQ